jgi:hypothetical protein
MKTSYASFGPTDLSSDAYVLSMEKAYFDGYALAKEGRPLKMNQVPQNMRQSYKRGYMAGILT